MPSQTPSASDFTNTVKNSAIVSASVGSSATKPRSSSSVPLVSVSSISSIVTRSRVAVLSGLQPAAVRQFDSVASKKWTFSIRTNPSSPNVNFGRICISGDGKYIALLAFQITYYSRNGGATWSSISHNNTLLNTRGFVFYGMSRNGKWLLIPSAGLTPGGRNQVIAYQTFNLDTATLYTLPSLGPFDQNTGITAGAIANNGTVYFHKAAADNMIYRCIFNGTSYANPVTFHAGYGRILLHEDDVKVFMTTAFYDGTSFKSVNFADLNVHYASSSDLSVILTGGSSASPKILRYNPATGNYASSWTTPVGNLTNRNIHTVACSADGKVMVCCCGWDQQDTSPRGFLISQDTGVTWSFIEHSKPVIDVAISPDGTRILALDTLNRIVEGVFA